MLGSVLGRMPYPCLTKKLKSHMRNYNANVEIKGRAPFVPPTQDYTQGFLPDPVICPHPNPLRNRPVGPGSPRQHALDLERLVTTLQSVQGHSVDMAMAK